jgi:fluoride exporter
MSSEPTPAIQIDERLRRSSGRARPPLGVLLAIGTGGALGALARYGIERRWAVAPGEFPWATLGINMSGSLVLGILVSLVIERWPPTRYVRPFAAIGICGGYTTWSTFMTEAALLVRDDRAGRAVIYLVVSLVAGLAATYGGIGLARLWPGESRGGPHEASRTG